MSVQMKIDENKKNIKIWQKLANKTKDKKEKNMLLDWIRQAFNTNKELYKQLDK